LFRRADATFDELHQLLKNEALQLRALYRSSVQLVFSQAMQRSRR
jgi:hypothetical protein